MDSAELVRRALEARGSAYAPYSSFSVGAAVLCDDGRVFRGANVENASYGLTLCAERVAIVNAVSHGARRFSALAIVTEEGSSPCGACRQFAREFASDLTIHLGKVDGSFESTTLAHLLPKSFGPEDLEG